MKPFVLISSLMLLSVQAAFAADVENGRKAYMREGCWGCHGYQGDGGYGPRIGHKPPPLAAMRNLIRTVERGMPRYTEKNLSDAEIADIHAYLVSLPASPDPASIPILKR